MGEDISRNTLFVLVILTLMLSALGTWTVLSQVAQLPQGQGAQKTVEPDTEGEVALYILKQRATDTEGEARLTILEA